MRMMKHLLLACALILGWAAAVQANVAVTFLHPERYTDAGLYRPYSLGPDAPALREIRAHLERLGAQHLTADQRLTIEVLDVDLAGRFEPWRWRAHDARILRGITWPRIKVRYRLERRGDVVLSAEETVTDLNYLMNPVARHSTDTLVHEKAMLNRWFRTRFVKGRPPPAGGALPRQETPVFQRRASEVVRTTIRRNAIP